MSFLVSKNDILVLQSDKNSKYIPNIKMGQVSPAHGEQEMHLFVEYVAFFNTYDSF